MPVSVLTGFLGSGKTTLLRRVLTDPAFADTAVIINEVGEIAIDHYLVDFVEGEVLELPGGCLCCAVREDLAQTLRDLILRRDAGEIRGFRRIVIETSGLADPAPVLFTLGTDPMLDQRLVLGRVVTLVDALAGATTLERFAEAARQVAVADALVISKTDLAPLGDALAARLDALNPAADRILGTAADPATIMFAPSRHPHPTHAASPHPNPPPHAGEGVAPALKNPPLHAGEGGARAAGVGGWGLADAFDAGARPARNFAIERADPKVQLFDAVRDYLTGEQNAGRRAAIAAYSEGSADRLATVLRERGQGELRRVADASALAKLPRQAVGLAILPLEKA